MEIGECESFYNFEDIDGFLGVFGGTPIVQQTRDKTDGCEVFAGLRVFGESADQVETFLDIFHSRDAGILMRGRVQCT
jgi:hypothetical protein